MAGRRHIALLLAAAALAAGCGGDDETSDEKDTGGTKTAGPARVAEDAKVEGTEGREMADNTVEFLNAKSGEDACYELLASDYVESLSGLEGCAKKMGPIVSGPLDTVTAAGPKPDGKTGTAEVESSGGGEKLTIEFALSVSTDKWNIDGLGE